MMNAFQKIQHKIVSLTEAVSRSQEWKVAGEIVVFTNGCFDILHQGHVVYLAKTAEEGTKLIVALNTDASVKRLGKGDERPINSENARLLVLASLECVDLVLLFDEQTPLSIIQTLKPSVLAKGADYDSLETDSDSKKYIVGSKEVKSAGGKVVTIPLEAGFSTTNIVNKLKNNP